MLEKTDTPFKVLIIDDEPLLKNLIDQKFKFQIKNNQLQFLYAYNGLEALTLLEANPDIGVLFTDLNMPGMDGITFLRQLHTQKGKHMYRPVVISAYGDMANVRAAMNCGATDFITKPVDIHDLEMTLMKTIDQYRYMLQGVQAQERMIEIQKELSIAKEIQQSFMTYNFHPFPNNSKVLIYGEVFLKENIGGDFFDFFPIDDHRLAIVMAELPDTGIPAAMRMLMLRTLIRSSALKTMNAQECIRLVNHILSEDDYSKLAPITAFYGVFDLYNGNLNYSIAGSITPYILSSDGNLLTLGQGQTGPALGKSDDIDKTTSLFANSTFSIQPGDLLFLNTRSLIEVTNVHSEMFTEMRLHNQILADINRTPEQFVKEIKTNIQSFSLGGIFDKDITIFCLRYLGNESSPEPYQ